MRRISLLLALIFCAVAWLAGESPAPRAVELTAADGTKLRATYYSAGKAGPGVMLFHQCNRDRKMWEELAPNLTNLGINVLTLDLRGYGESEGTSAFKLSAEESRKMIVDTWPADVDKAYAYLTAQPEVKKELIGAAGASCGVNQSVQLARRHPQVKSLVLLSGDTNRQGRVFLQNSSQIPIFGAAADDDNGAVEVLQWIVAYSRNPGNQFYRYANGGHGIEMFAPHPELTTLIVNWFDTTLLKTPGHAPVNAAHSVPKQNILVTIDEPGGAAKASAILADARKRDPNARPFTEGIVNLIGYEHLQEGDKKGAIEIFKLNTVAYPNSPNTYDSLSDAYVADGQSDQAIQNAEKALKVLESDTAIPEARRKAIRESAEQKLKQLKSGNT